MIDAVGTGVKMTGQTSAASRQFILSVLNLIVTFLSFTPMERAWSPPCDSDNVHERAVVDEDVVQGWHNQTPDLICMVVTRIRQETMN